MGEERRNKKIEVVRSRQKAAKWSLGRQKTKNLVAGQLEGGKLDPPAFSG